MKNRVALAAERLLTEAYGQGSAILARRRAVQVAAALALGAAMTLPAVAEAQSVSGGASPATMINNICTFILGPFGQSLAVLGIIAIGLSWMFGRVSLGLIAGVIGGIVIMFGASYLGSTLTGGTGG
jgi:type IV secretion system protein VirB2